MVKQYIKPICHILGEQIKMGESTSRGVKPVELERVEALMLNLYI